MRTTASSFEHTALATAVRLLKVLLAAAEQLRPGRNAVRHAENVRDLGEGASQAAFDLWASLDDSEARRTA